MDSGALPPVHATLDHSQGPPRPHGRQGAWGRGPLYLRQVLFQGGGVARGTNPEPAEPGVVLGRRGGKRGGDSVGLLKIFLAQWDWDPTTEALFNILEGSLLPHF